MSEDVDLCCPRCSEVVPDIGRYTIGQHRRATNAQHARSATLNSYAIPISKTTHGRSRTLRRHRMKSLAPATSKSGTLVAHIWGAASAVAIAQNERPRAQRAAPLASRDGRVRESAVRRLLSSGQPSRAGDRLGDHPIATVTVGSRQRIGIGAMLRRRAVDVREESRNWRISRPRTNAARSPALRLTRYFCNRGLEQPTAATCQVSAFRDLVPPVIPDLPGL
jgi:hypothetical protein